MPAGVERHSPDRQPCQECRATIKKTPTQRVKRCRLYAARVALQIDYRLHNTCYTSGSTPPTNAKAA